MKSIAIILAGLVLSAAAEVDMLACNPGEDCATEARIVWHSTDAACTLHCARAGERRRPFEVPCAKQRCPVAFLNGGTDYYKYTATLKGLRPGTEYLYWVAEGGRNTPHQLFRTAGRSGKFNFLWLSDVHAHHDKPLKMTNVAAIVECARRATASSGGIDFVLFSGDMVKYGARYDDWRQWNGSVVQTDYMRADVTGNKEYYETGKPTHNHDKWFLAVHNNPPNGADGIGASYWFLYDGVLFLCIDSRASEGREMPSDVRREALARQMAWFERAVSSQRGRFRRLVVCQHDPWFLYNNAKGRGHVRRWAPLFDRYKVDLALSGDDHNYLRTKPLKWSADEERFVPDGDGTVYMVASMVDETSHTSTVTTDMGAIAGTEMADILAAYGTSGATYGAIVVSVGPVAIKVKCIWNRKDGGGYDVLDSFEAR